MIKTECGAKLGDFILYVLSVIKRRREKIDD